MEKRWLEHPKITPSIEILDWLKQSYGLPFEQSDSHTESGIQLVAETLLRRGFQTQEQAQAFLDPQAYRSCSPFEFPGMQIAVQRLQHAIQSRETILVWGDFDVDGQTSTSLLVSALRQLGGKVLYHIPVRESESHGIQIPVLSQFLRDRSQGKISLILTCDTGISAAEAIAYANQQGVEVLVTDHHELPAQLPQAIALVNPNFLPEDHALHSLAGVGVAYKLAEALFQAFGKPELVEQFLDLAALGCVADVAQLHGETRYLVQRGLQAISERKRLGLRLMLEAAEIPIGSINEEVIGFVLGPRMNALGRLGDANPIVEFLIGEDEPWGRIFVAKLEALNARRQLLTSQIFQGALAQIEREPGLLDEPVLVLSHPAWHAGVIGIVASRLVEQFGKPVIMLSSPPGEAARGSARSVDGFDITAALRWVQEETQKHSSEIAPTQPVIETEKTTSSQNSPGIFRGFGGHRMAAGMSLPAERIPELRMRLRQAAKLQTIPEPTLQVDAFLELSEIDFPLAEQLERLAPYGAGNPPLLLASRNLKVRQMTKIGRSQEHLKLQIQDAKGFNKEFLWWGSADTAAELDLTSKPLDIAYKLRASSFRGQPQLQLTWVDFRISTKDVSADDAPQRMLIDYRSEKHPLPILAELLQKFPAVPIWAEAEAVPALRQQFPNANLVDRLNWTPHPVLIIWTAPLSRAELAKALIQVQPETIYLFNLAPDSAKLNPFLQRLAGLVKYRLNVKHGHLELGPLAAATGQSLLTVRLGLDWMAAKGYVSIQEDRGEELIVNSEKASADGQKSSAQAELAGGESNSSDKAKQAEKLAKQILVLLEESAAFRLYYARSDKSRLTEIIS